MSSRKSARLSAAASHIKQDVTPDEEAPKVETVSKKRKAAAQKGTELVSKKRIISPSTPKKKTVPKVLPPVTPTPAAIGLMSIPYSSGDIDDNMPPHANRLVVRNGTNAPLVTPETHRLLVTKPMDQVSPSKPSNIKHSTGKVLDEALAHLVKVEPRLKRIIDQHHCHVFSPEGLAEEIDPFRSLVSGIISQQVRW